MSFEKEQNLQKKFSFEIESFFATQYVSAAFLCFFLQAMNILWS
jgi:hypothetical protein